MKKLYQKTFEHYGQMKSYFNKLAKDSKISNVWCVGNELTVYWIYR